MDYTTYDQLDDLSLAKMAGAHKLNFATYVSPFASSYTPWDNEASYSESERFAALRDVFSFSLTKNATYYISSSSFFDPFLIELYDQYGNVIAYSSEGSESYGYDYIRSFKAPYTGTYYAEAGWDQGDYHKFVSFSIYEDIDTIPTEFILTNLADVFESTPTNDLIDGLNGIDYVVFPKRKVFYDIKKITNGFSINDIFSINDEYDEVINVERLWFSNYFVALDVNSMGGRAGEVAKIIGAVFGASAINNRDYVGVGLHQLDNGMSVEGLCGLAISATGKTDYSSIVNLLWRNVVGSPISDRDRGYYVGLLENGMSVSELTALAADTSLNEANIDLIGLAQTGIAYNHVFG